ncbi:MAG: hypothetical protein U0325_23435 [Polyangiales bacterium]
MSPPDDERPDPADPADREALIEAAAGAWRGRSPHGEVRAHPAWHDLDADGRVEAHDRAATSRTVEAALDPEGLSTTARAVLARIRNAAR